MNTIETIKAEVERLKPRIRKICGEEVKIPVEKVREKFDTLLSFLSDLEKEEKPMNPQPVKIDIRKELASIEFMGVNDARDTETIARHFYALGQQSKEQPVCEDVEMEIKETELEYQQRSERGEYPASIESIARHFYELGRQSKPTTAEGLEEEIREFVEQEWDGLHDNDGNPLYTADYLEYIARHFAKWGAEHRGSSEVPKDLEEAAVEYSAIGYSPFDDPYEKHQQFECSKFAFIAGAKWDREQMMKEAVEGRITQDSNTKLIVVSEPIEGFKFGDKGHIIFVKED